MTGAQVSGGKLVHGRQRRAALAAVVAAVVAGAAAAVGLGWWLRPAAIDSTPLARPAGPALAVQPAPAPPPLTAAKPVVPSTATASAASTRRPVPAWTELTLQTPLADVLTAAQAGGRAAELLAAMRLLAGCVAARSWSEAQLAAINDMRLSAMLPAPAASAAARQSGQQHRSLLRYCEALDDAAIEAQAKAVGERLRANASPWPALAGQPRKTRGETWPAAQYQAALLTLTDPVAQAAALDTVLRMMEPPLPTGAAGLNTYQADVVRTLVAQELSGDRNPLSLANTTACVQRAVCDVGTAAFAADPANRTVVAAAQRWVQLIRTQQWAAMGLVPR